MTDIILDELKRATALFRWSVSAREVLESLGFPFDCKAIFSVLYTDHLKLVRVFSLPVA